MKNRLIVYGVLCGGIAVIIVCVSVIYAVFTSKDLHVVFLDVGQGDAVLISQGTHQILIDGGPDGTVLLEELSTYMPFWDRTIEVVVATHPDSDHIDGLIDVFGHYHVKQLWHTSAAKDTATYKKLMHRAHMEDDIELIDAYNGLKAMYANAVFEVIYPYSDDVADQNDVNDTSITTILNIADEKFYFGGDLTSEIEDALPIDDVGVLKASHHGSNSSTSAYFLQKLQPRDVIISSGAHNRYGHPHDDVLTRVYRSGADVYRTDQWGSVEYVCKQDFGCRILP
jgi:competence protein ComEC